jgi:hypothetical protein
MRIGEEIQGREKKQRIAQIYTDISYYGKLKEPTSVTDYHYLPFDWGERD